MDITPGLELCPRNAPGFHIDLGKLAEDVAAALKEARDEGYQAGREAAARAIEEHAELAGWGEVWAQAVSIAKGMDLRLAEEAGDG